MQLLGFFGLAYSMTDTPKFNGSCSSSCDGKSLATLLGVSGSFPPARFAPTFATASRAGVRESTKSFCLFSGREVHPSKRDKSLALLMLWLAQLKQEEWCHATDANWAPTGTQSSDRAVEHNEQEIVHRALQSMRRRLSSRLAGHCKGKPRARDSLDCSTSMRTMLPPRLAGHCEGKTALFLWLATNTSSSRSRPTRGAEQAMGDRQILQVLRPLFASSSLSAMTTFQAVKRRQRTATTGPGAQNQSALVLQSFLLDRPERPKAGLCGTISSLLGLEYRSLAKFLHYLDMCV